MDTEPMPTYFLVLDARRYHEQICPALGECWRRRSFAPAGALAEALAGEARAFLDRYSPGTGEPLLAQVAAGLPFDRHTWRCLVGEVLLCAAADMPRIPLELEPLVCLIERRAVEDLPAARDQLMPVQQVYHGSRDLVLGGGFYRPEQVGVNDRADVARLAAYLDAVDAAAWQAEDLSGLPGLDSEEDCREELAYTREWFPTLRELYRQAQEQDRVIVCEQPI